MTSPALPWREVRQRASTLVEILVVIGVMAVLLGVLLPAVLRARESSARLQCANNLKQIGLGFQSHHDALGIFPTAGQYGGSARVFSARGPAAGTAQDWGWAYQVLPFVGEGALWQHPDDGVVAGSAVKFYFCPTRRPPQVIEGRAMIDYAGISGSTTYFNMANQDGMVVQIRHQNGSPLNPPVRLADVKDSTSTTLLVAEKRLNVAALGQAQNDDNEGYTSGFDQDAMRYGGGAPLPDCLTGTGDFRLGSSHPGYFLGVLVDGSVRGFAYNLDLVGVFRPLCSRNDRVAFRLD